MSSRNVIPGKGILLRLPDSRPLVATRWRDPAFALAVVCGAVVLRLTAPGRGIDSLYDEGIVVGAAWRVIMGQVPYFDFWHLHPPGTAWLLAGCFRIFGTSLAVERGLDAAVFAASAGLVFLLARDRAGRAVSVAAATLFALSPCQTTSLRPRDLGLLFCVASFAACLVFFDRPPRARWLVLAGTLAGASAWFKQDFAAAALGALVLSVLVKSGAPPRERARNAFVAAASALAAFLPLPALLFLQGAAHEAWSQAIVFPATRFEEVRGLSVTGFGAHAWDLLVRSAPAREILVTLTPLFVYVFAVAGLLLAVDLCRRRESRDGAVLLGLGLLGLFLTARVRADGEHLLPPLAIALVLAAWWVAAPGERRLRTWHGGVGALSACLLVLLAAAANPAEPESAFPPGTDEAFRARSRGLTGADPDFLLSAADVSRRTVPGESIFCGNSRHDVTSVNPALFYFAADRPNATRYDNLHPGVVTTLAVQEEIVRDLEAKHVRVVVLWREPVIAEASPSSGGSRLLDAYLSREFQPAGVHGRYEVRVRR